MGEQKTEHRERMTGNFPRQHRQYLLRNITISSPARRHTVVTRRLGAGARAGAGAGTGAGATLAVISAVLKDFQLASVQFCPVKLGDGILHVAA